MKLKNLKILITSIIGVALIIVLGAVFLFLKKDNKELISVGEKIQNQIQQISILANQSILQFQNIKDEQEREDLRKALDLVVEEKTRNKEINNLALALTEELKKLAEMATELSSEKDRQKIESAIQFQIEAISHLLNYGSGVDIVLQELAQKYEAKLENKDSGIKRDMGQLIDLIKKEIESAQEKSQLFVKNLNEVFQSN